MTSGTAAAAKEERVRRCSAGRRESSGVAIEVVVEGTSNTAIGGLISQRREVAQVDIIAITKGSAIEDRDIQKATTTEQLRFTLSKQFDHDSQKMNEQKSKAEPCPLKS